MTQCGGLITVFLAALGLLAGLACAEHESLQFQIRAALAHRLAGDSAIVTLPLQQAGTKMWTSALFGVPLVVDLGSSMLATCNASAAAYVVPATLDGLDIGCVSYGKAGSGEFWAGPLLSSTLNIAGTATSATLQVLNASVFVATAYRVFCGAHDGVDMQGIFGLGNATGDVSQTSAAMITSCADTSVVKRGAVPPVFAQIMAAAAADSFAVYLNEPTSSGALDLGSNLSVPSPATLVATELLLIEAGNYRVYIASIGLEGSQQQTQIDDYYTLDTGTPQFLVSKAVYDALCQPSCPTAGNLTFVLESGATLVMDLALLQNYGTAPLTGNSSSTLIGMPFWFFYGTVFNVQASTVSFWQM